MLGNNSKCASDKNNKTKINKRNKILYHENNKRIEQQRSNPKITVLQKYSKGARN